MKSYHFYTNFYCSILCKCVQIYRYKRKMPTATLASILLCLCSSLVAVSSTSSVDYETSGATVDNLPVFYQGLRQQLNFSLAWQNGSSAPRQFSRWRATARAKLWELLLVPDDQKTPFNAVQIDAQDRGTYVARKMVLSITRNSRVLALLLEPKGDGPFPGALMLHDHGAKFDIGKEKMVKPWGNDTVLASAQAWAAKYYSGRFIGDVLAERGYTVLATDALGWGDRKNNGVDSQQALASNFFNLGSSLAGTMALEDVRAARYLASLPKVDKKRVASVGFSMGSFRAWQVSSLTDEVTAGIAVNWMSTLDQLMVPSNNQLRGSSAFYMLHPGIFQYLDYPDAASVAAPKPMLFYAGAIDPLFPEAGASAAFAKMQNVWTGAAAKSNLSTKVWPNTTHIFLEAEQEEAFDWLDVQFKRNQSGESTTLK